MALKLTPAILEAAYELLRLTPPFERWNLPSGEDIKFCVIKSKDIYGQAWRRPLRIDISSGKVGQFPLLLSTMAHEMVHIHQYQTGMDRRSAHGQAFQKLAGQVCHVHLEFDRKAF